MKSCSGGIAVQPPANLPTGEDSYGQICKIVSRFCCSDVDVRLLMQRCGKRASKTGLQRPEADWRRDAQTGCNVVVSGRQNNNGGNSTNQPNNQAGVSYRQTDLVGAWACENSVIILLTGGRYESYVNGQPTQAGTWSLDRASLSFTSADGQQEIDTIKSLTADTVTIELDDGRTTVWKKTNWRPGENRQTLTAAAFVGTWTAANGATIVFSHDGRFASYAQGRIVSQGTFAIQGQTLILRHPNDATESYKIQMYEGGFTAIDERGNSLNYSRSGQ